VSLYRYLLIADLRLGDWPALFDKFRRANLDSKHLLETFMRKVAEMRMVGNYSSAERNQLQRIVG
jgi:hypothetical protein